MKLFDKRYALTLCLAVIGASGSALAVPPASTIKSAAPAGAKSTAAPKVVSEIKAKGSTKSQAPAKPKHEIKIPPSVSALPAKTALAKGKELSSQKKYKESLPYFSHVINSDPTLSGEAILGRGKSQVQLARYEEAADDYLRYTQMYPQDADGYLNLGQAFFKLGKNQQALFYLNRAVVLRPKNAFTYVQRALVYDALGKKDMAASDRDLAKKLGFDGSDDTKP